MRTSGSLRNVLDQVMEGEAFMVARKVGCANGIDAQRRPHQKPSPSTPATALMDTMWVMLPGRTNNHLELIAKVEEW